MHQASEADAGMGIEVSNTQSGLLIDPSQLAGMVRRILLQRGLEAASISVTVVDNPTIQRINRDHLEHDWPTDVITFPLSEPGEARLEGEIIVSAEMALETALAAGSDPMHELALYLVHGLLHLLGFDDGSASDRDAMRTAEADALSWLGIPNTFHRTGEAPGSSAPVENPTCSA